MSEIIKISGGVTAPVGFSASGVFCGVKRGISAFDTVTDAAQAANDNKDRQKNDIGILVSETPCAAAATYTQNKVKGAPIVVTKRNLLNHTARAVIANSGNANTCNADGEQKAQLMCDMLAAELDISASDIVVASTGVIGKPLPSQPILDAIRPLVKGLKADGGDEFSKAIMTTDTVMKTAAVEFIIDGTRCRIGGTSKGSGMIHPNMATMLAFITSDVDIAPELLQKALSDNVKITYNMISVDGDTSTNDMCCVLANGMAGNKKITGEGESYDTFCAALNEVNRTLAKLMAKDGEGATKLLECNVKGAPTYYTAAKVAKSVICSSLLKAAMFGADANWGRVLCAIGYTDADFDITKTEVNFTSTAGVLPVCENGAGIAFSEELAKKLLSEDEIAINIDLHGGDSCATVWGCDLTYDYVKINGDYRT